MNFTEALKRNNNMIIFGTGEYMRIMYKKLDPELRILYFCDNNPNAWGTYPVDNHIQCISPMELAKMDHSFVLIAALKEETIQSIGKQLEDIQMNYCHIDEAVTYFRKEFEDKELKKQLHPEAIRRPIANIDNMRCFIDAYIPVENCNLRCCYCYVQQHNMFRSRKPFMYSAQFIRKALCRERLGGTCFINLCAGGETLLLQDIDLLIEELLKEGHYVQVVTNGTVTKMIDRILQLDSNLLNHLYFKLSFHYTELKRLKLLDVFKRNVYKIKDSNASFSIELVPHDEIIPEISEIKAYCLKQFGALPQLTITRNENTADFELLTKINIMDYKKIWGEFSSLMFDFKMDYIHKKPCNYCHAGEWSFSLNLGSGEMHKCTHNKFVDNIFCDITKPIRFEPIGKECVLPYCFNNHVYLTLGLIPEVQAPTYLEVRDRIDHSGEHWIKPAMAQFFRQKLYENN